MPNGILIKKNPVKRNGRKYDLWNKDGEVDVDVAVKMALDCRKRLKVIKRKSDDFNDWKAQLEDRYTAQELNFAVREIGYDELEDIWSAEGELDEFLAEWLEQKRADGQLRRCGGYAILNLPTDSVEDEDTEKEDPFA